MKKLFLLFAGVYLLTACGKDPALVDGSDHTYRLNLYTVEEARMSYERACKTISRSEAEGVLTPGDYIVDWDGAQISIDSTLYSVDVPIELAYEYYRYLEIEGEVYWIPLYPKLVAVSTPDKERSSVYIRYFIPHEYFEWAHDPSIYDEMLNSGAKQDYTGLSLYTTLAGDPVCAVRYEKGRLETYGFLYDEERTMTENAELMNTILDGVRIGRADKSVSRGIDTNEDDPIIDLGDIEVVPIYPEPEDENENDDEMFDKWPVLPVPGGDISDSPGGGGGSGSGTGTGSGEGDGNGDGNNNQISSKYNANIKYEDKDTIEPLLDSLAEDCLSSTLFEKLSGVSIETGAGNSYFDHTTGTIFLSGEKGYRDYVLLEELLHAYQYQQYGSEYAGRMLNNEVEAKVGWLIYLTGRDRFNQIHLSSKLGPDYMIIACLADSIAYDFYDPIRDADMYIAAKESIRKAGKNKPYEDMTYVEDHSFSQLLNLLINCAY